MALEKILAAEALVVAARRRGGKAAADALAKQIGYADAFELKITAIRMCSAVGR